jgi:hypothetical protein
MVQIPDAQRTQNLRTGIVLGAVALFFFLAVIAKYYWLNA